ncbi:unnamed protein product [Brachionus calyciflorus]|uniref:TASOR pseudo-PARP domain-containing protein n=1 Tax=Brachionus calyciflorus TaxID=104777 RepID=A0A813QZR8_9BILA|nr:unnamed protein product [Brachionus calyciflorus]
MFNSLMPNPILQNSHHHHQHHQTLTLPTSLNQPTQLPTQTNGFKMLFELESNTTLNKTIINLLKKSYFIKKSLNWQPVKYELVVNNKLMQEFEQIKDEFKSHAKEELEYEENYGYLIENEHQINEIVQNGYCCQDNNYNVIGQSKSGVYLCKYPDVAIKYNESRRYPDHFTFKMIIFKICYGKQTLALVRKDAKLAPIPATINFNSHMSVIAPKEKDDIEAQFDHSQIYLYEHDANKLPIKRPRHCLPYAVVTWLKTDESNEWPVSFTDLEIIPQNGESNGHQNGENHEAQNESKGENKNAINETKTETQIENPEAEIKTVTSEEEKTVENHDEPSKDPETNKTDTENLNSKSENNEQSSSEQRTTSPSKQEPTNNPSVTPNSSQVQINALNGTPVAPTTPNGTPAIPKPANNFYPKPTAYTAYRHAVPTAMNPYIYQANHLAGLRLPYAGAPQIPAQALAALPNQQYINQAPLQQQVFLCRGPNGLTYVTAASPAIVSQQLAVAQAQAQAQAQAILQQQVLQAQVQQQQQLAAAGLQFQKFPQQIINNQIIQTQQQPQPTQQIIYQAAPQPANTQKPSQTPSQQTNQPSQQQNSHVPQTQSPKTQQLNGQQTLLAYGPQQGQQMYTPSPSTQAAIATQQGYMLAGTNLQQQQAQQQQIQQIQQLQQQQLQQQQLLNYQLAGGSIGLPGQAAHGQGLAAVPGGYQLVDYRQLQGIPGAVSLDQLAGLAGVQRARLLQQARHHPYQRP